MQKSVCVRADYMQAAAAVESGSPPNMVLLAATPEETGLLDITPQETLGQRSAHSGDSASSRHSRAHISRTKQAAAVPMPDLPLRLVQP